MNNMKMKNAKQNLLMVSIDAFFLYPVQVNQPGVQDIPDFKIQ